VSVERLPSVLIIIEVVVGEEEEEEELREELNWFDFRFAGNRKAFPLEEEECLRFLTEKYRRIDIVSWEVGLPLYFSFVLFFASYWFVFSLLIEFCFHQNRMRSFPSFIRLCLLTHSPVRYVLKTRNRNTIWAAMNKPEQRHHGNGTHDGNRHEVLS